MRSRHARVTAPLNTTVRTGVLRVRAFAPRLRVPLLVLAGLVVAHDAIFASDAGFAAVAGALARSGHGDTWALVSLLGLLGAAIVAVGSVARILRLRREIVSLDAARRFSGGTGRTIGTRATIGEAYRAEVRRLWPRLFTAIALGFLLQENVEAVFGGGHTAGLEPLLGAHPFAVPILLVLTLAMAAAGALVRRHTQVLEQLVTQLRARAPRHTEWRTPRASLGALHPRDLIRLRPQAGRAPPLHAALVPA